MLEEALNYFTRGEDNLTKAVGGSLLVLSSFLVLPFFLFMGYLVRVTREDTLPGLENLTGMLKEGLQAFLILFLLMLPGGLVIALTDGLTGLLAGLLLQDLGFYHVFAALYGLGNSGFADAFRLESLRRAWSLDYLLGVLVAVMLGFGGLLLFLVSLLMFFPILLFPVFVYAQHVFMFRVVTEAIENQAETGGSDQ